MGLTVRGRDILSDGEFIALTRDLEPDFTGSGILQAWWAGHDPGPEGAHVALDLEARVAARSDEGVRLIERGLRRLKESFPGVAV